MRAVDDVARSVPPVFANGVAKRRHVHNAEDTNQRGAKGERAKNANARLAISDCKRETFRPIKFNCRGFVRLRE